MQAPFVLFLICFKPPSCDKLGASFFWNHKTLFNDQRVVLVISQDLFRIDKNSCIEGSMLNTQGRF